MPVIERDACVLDCGKPLSRRYRLGTSELLNCPACGMTYLSPYLSTDDMRGLYQSKESLGKMFPHFKDYFLSCGDPDLTATTRAGYLKWLAAAERALGKKGRLFDLGCGNGLFMKLAQDGGWKVSGIDFSPENAEFAKTHFGLHVECGDVFEKTPPPGSFEAVTLWDVVEHVENPLKILQMARQLLVPGGVVLAALPRERNIFTAIAKSLYRATGGRAQKLMTMLYPVEHLTYYNRASARALFHAADLSVEILATENSDLGRLSVSPAMKAAMAGLNMAAHFTDARTKIIVLARKNKS